MALTELLIDAGPDIYYDANFRKVLEDHMTWLRNHPKSETIVIAPNDANTYRGDFFGLMQLMGIAPQYHWLMMRLNKYTAPHQLTYDTTSLLKCDFTVVDRIRQSHQAISRIS